MAGTPKPLRPRKTPRQKRSTATHEEILRAAAHVFVEHGYTAGTTNRIAQAASVSIGSLYQYFPNKDAILLQLARQHIDQARNTITDAFQDGLPATWPERIAVLVDATLEAHREDARLHRVLFEESPRPPALLAEIHTLQEALVEATADLLRTDFDDSPELRLTAWFLVATTDSLVHRHLTDRPIGGAAAFREGLITMLTGFLRNRVTPR